MKNNKSIIVCLALLILSGCDSADDGLRDVSFEVKGIDPIRATRADILVVADNAAGPGLDTLRFLDQPLPWRLKLRDVEPGALLLEACIDTGVVQARVDAGERAFTVHGFGEEYTPHICAFGRMGPIRPNLPCDYYGPEGCS